MNGLPVGTHTDVVHIELDGLGLLLVLEMVISQQVVDLINDCRCWGATFRKARGLKGKKKIIMILSTNLYMKFRV